MLKKYALKMGIGMKKIHLSTNEKEYKEGHIIEGGIKFLVVLSHRRLEDMILI